MIYRRRPTALHATGPVPALLWCAGLLVAALLAPGAPDLALVAATVLGAGFCAQVGPTMLRSARWALGLALAILVINALVSQAGATIIWHFGTLPLVGDRYITAQAVGSGALLGLRAMTLVLIGTLFSLGVDPDALLRLGRRLSFRSALTVTIATRLVPLLMRDAGALAEAMATREGPPPGRVALLGAATHNMLDRALDVAAALEVRGFGLSAPGGGSAPGGVGARLRAARPPRGRHDRAFLAAAAATVLCAGLARGLSPWWMAGVPALALAPFLDSRGVR